MRTWSYESSSLKLKGSSDMPKPMYEFKMPDEAGWATIAIALGGLVSVVLTAIGVEQETALAIGGGVSATARFVLAFILSFISASPPPPPGP